MVTTGQYAISSQAVSPWYNTGSQYRTREAQDVRVENGAGLIVGHTAQETISIDGATDLVPEVQVLGTAAADATVMLAAFSTTATIAGSPILAFVKGGNASIGSHTVVTDGEELGNIVAYGDDGTDLEAIAAQIQFEVDGTPGTGDMPGRIILATTADGAETATERMRINSSGDVIIGHTTSLNIGAGATTALQVLGTAFADSGISAGRFSADASGPSLRFAKSRHGSIVNSSGTIVADGDILGDIIFAADDGSDLRTVGAQIQAKVDGTPGSDDMPTRLIFLTTADGASSVTERMRISSAGKVVIPNAGGLVVGHSAQVSPEGATPEVQIIGSGQADTALGMVRYSNDAGGIQLFMAKSRGASLGTNTAPANNDLIGGIYWCIADATDNDLGPQAAYFRAAVDGTPGNNDSPGRLEFATTADGSGGATERLRIANDGGIFAYNLLAASASTDVNINGSDELHSVTSSEYYKYDKRTLEVDSSLIYQLQPRSYRFGAKKPDAPADWPMADGEADDWGLTAEEVYEVLPSLVNLKDGKPYSVKYSMLSVLLLNEIKKLREAA